MKNIRTLVLAFIVLLFCQPSLLLANCVQKNSGTCAVIGFGGGTCTLSFSSSQTAGHSNLATVLFCNYSVHGTDDCSQDPTGEVVTATDGAGNIYTIKTGMDTTRMPLQGYNEVRAITFLAANINSSGSGNTVTFTFPGQASDLTVTLAECVGNTYDVSTGTAITSDNCTATTGSTAHATETVYVVGGPGTATSGALTSGYTAGSSTALLIDGWKDVSSTGTQSATLTQSGGGGTWCHVHVLTLYQGVVSSAGSPLTTTGVGQ